MIALAAAIRDVTTLLAELGGLALLAATFAALTAFLYRWYVREAVPAGFAVLVGLSTIAAYLNTTSVLGAVLGGSTEPTQIEVALFNIFVIAIGTIGAYAGRTGGDRLGGQVFQARTFGGIDEDVGTLVRAVGRVITVRIPDEIDDVVGYDPVPAETKTELAGTQFHFPRRLTLTELETRLTSRLRTDYGVGHVDVDLAEDGTIEHLGLGSRAAGIGPTLPPSTNAVAVRADPAFAASAGDVVQVWETDPMRRVLTAELRGVAGDVVTLAIDAADTPKLDSTVTYRLVTLPVEDRPDREFASLLRTADETFSSVTVEAGSPLDGLPVGALDVTVIAAGPADERVEVLPESTRLLRASDVVHAVARPEALRRLEVAARAVATSETASVGDPDPATGVEGPEVDSEPAGGSADDGGSAGGDALVPPEDRSILSDDGRTDPDGAPGSASADGTGVDAGEPAEAADPTEDASANADREGLDDATDDPREEPGREDGDGGPDRRE